MDKLNFVDAELAYDQFEKETIATDNFINQPSAQMSTDVEKATGNTPLEISVTAGPQPAAPVSDQGRVIDWDSSQDPQNPQNWTSTRKWIIIILVSAITFNQ